MLFSQSLNKNKDFLRLYKNGKSMANSACIFYYAPNKLPFNRLGITTSKKIGNAVLRNRAKRIIKAAYQQNELNFPIGFDFVIVARSLATTVKSDKISDFLLNKVIKEVNKPFIYSDKKKKA